MRVGGVTLRLPAFHFPYFFRHCEEPTGPARSGRPDDKLRDEAIQNVSATLDCFASLAMTTVNIVV
jgi:hypothetical protein